MQEMERVTDKRKFDACRMEIVSFGAKDVIATSGFESEDNIFFTQDGYPVDGADA